LKFEITLGAGGSVVRPVVKIDGLPTQDSCAEHTIFDARRSSGNLGREFSSAEWIFLDAPASLTQATAVRVQNQLKDSFDGAMLQAEIICVQNSRITSNADLPGPNDVLCSSLTIGIYTVGLNVTNWVGMLGTATFSWNRVDYSGMPVLRRTV